MEFDLQLLHVEWNITNITTECVISLTSNKAPSSSQKEGLIRPTTTAFFFFFFFSCLSISIHHGVVYGYKEWDQVLLICYFCEMHGQNNSIPQQVHNVTWNIWMRILLGRGQEFIIPLNSFNLFIFFSKINVKLYIKLFNFKQLTRE